MLPVVRACEGQSADYFMIHTGQHYSYEMDPGVLGGLGLPDARYTLDVGGPNVTLGDDI